VIRTRVAIVGAIALFAASCWTPSLSPDERVGYNRSPSPDVSSVRFVDYSAAPSGEPFTPVARRGELLLMYFGYLSCPDVCPTTMAEISSALDLMAEDQANRFTVGMVSVDPERDEGVAISKYLDVFVERHHGLLAPNAVALDEAATLFGVLYEIEEHDEGSTSYDVGHSATVFVVDEDGLIIWEFGFNPDREAGLVADSLESILLERYG
jgi:protein SCO1/2